MCKDLEDCTHDLTSSLVKHLDDRTIHSRTEWKLSCRNEWCKHAPYLLRQLWWSIGSRSIHVHLIIRIGPKTELSNTDTTPTTLILSFRLSCRWLSQPRRRHLPISGWWFGYFAYETAHEESTREQVWIYMRLFQLCFSRKERLHGCDFCTPKTGKKNQHHGPGAHIYKR